MSQPLHAVDFPLRGARLIEASAGTGKTWTIAALYIRLVLGHGGEHGYGRPLLPTEILVMTFTRAATRELSDRIRQRLVQAAAYFRGEPGTEDDPFLQALSDSYREPQQALQAAHRLMMAAEAMDECAIFTIDAWCQRMLREHAFDSGCLFDEELISSETSLLDDAVRDYWRQQVYPLPAPVFAQVAEAWADVHALRSAIPPMLNYAERYAELGAASLAQLLTDKRETELSCAQQLKNQWRALLEELQLWLEKHSAILNGNRLRKTTLAAFFESAQHWLDQAQQIMPDKRFLDGCDRLNADNLQTCFKKDQSAVLPQAASLLPELKAALLGFEPVQHVMLKHAAVRVAQRMQQLKQMNRQFGFADMLQRLRLALESANGTTLARRMSSQYPVALIDEFQDTSPDQYRIFDLLYRLHDAETPHGIFLIGDPKQAIYGFRGADIHSYLDARRATSGRHYVLNTNFRSSAALVGAVNQLFELAEGSSAQPGYPAGAFRYRTAQGNPLPFEPVQARGRAERFVTAAGSPPAMTLSYVQQEMSKVELHQHVSAVCAEQIVSLLNDACAGFLQDEQLTPVKPADIAILVRDRSEARAVRHALQQRGVASVYLSDKDSIFDSDEARDMLLWLQAIANPMQAATARAAYATRSANLSLQELATLVSDDLAWEARTELLRQMHSIWQRQGILAMLRRFIHELHLPATLLAQTGGERRLTDMLHLAELLQSASQQLDGEQALIRWLAEQIHDPADSGADELVLRLESDAELVQVITIHKSKGLEFPIVFLPFAAAARPVARRAGKLLTYTDADGVTQLDLTQSKEVLELADAARLEEDLRLLYVALTRPRHALWMGVTAQKGRFQHSALGYLLNAGNATEAGQLAQLLQPLLADSAIAVQDSSEQPGLNRLMRQQAAPVLQDAPVYTAQFERNWSVASYTSITRGLGETRQAHSALMEKLSEVDDAASWQQVQDSPWHRFPRGPVPGQFLHEQLEWLAGEGFDFVHSERYRTAMEKRCERAGWAHRQDDVIAWLAAVCGRELPALGCALSGLQQCVPEMEFWFPASGLLSAELDQLCRQHVLPGLARPALSERDMHGMLRGFQDLVFCHEGRYWVMDYKSNTIGPNDASYHSQALQLCLVHHRYDVQGVLYLLALHRLLRQRLGEGYAPEQHLGGALFYFMRGVAHPDTAGCIRIAPDAALLAQLDQLFPAQTSL